MPEKGLPRKLVMAVALGTPLTPLNSTMIAVALVRIQTHFGVSLATTTWLVSAFYLAAAVGQPVVGRLADMLGLRRAFCAGLILCGISGALTPFSPSIGWMVACRVLLAIGTSAAFPSGLAILRRAAEQQGALPTAAMSVTSMSAATSAALGPVIGGFLITVADWPAIFLVNVPLTAAALVAALRWIPRDPPAPVDRSWPRLIMSIDFAGMFLFAGTVTALLTLLLSFADRPLWPLLALVLVGPPLIWWRDRRAREPFLGLRLLARNHALLSVLSQFIAVNIVFYIAYYGMPAWLEGIRGMSPAQTGLLLVPASGVAIVMTPIVARYVARHGTRRVVLIGNCLLGVDALALLLLEPRSPVWLIASVALVLGLPNAFNNFGLQIALYQATTAAETGKAAGLFQMSRYTGAIVSAVVIGLAYGQHVTPAGFRATAVVAGAVSAGLVAVSLLSRRLKEPENGF